MRSSWKGVFKKYDKFLNSEHAVLVMGEFYEFSLRLCCRNSQMHVQKIKKIVKTSVSRSFIRVIATATTRRVLREQWRSKSMKLQETKLWKCNKWLIWRARFWEVSTFWRVQTTSKDWLRSKMWSQGFCLDFLSIRRLDVMAGWA